MQDVFLRYQTRAGVEWCLSTVLVAAMSEVVISSTSASLRAVIDSLSNDFFQETFLIVFCIIFFIFFILKRCW